MLAIASSLIKARVRRSQANDSKTAIHAIESGDLPTLFAAEALHDVGQEREKRAGRDHALIGAEMAEKILTGTDSPASAIPGVLQAIRAHRTTGTSVPTTLEGRILFTSRKLIELRKRRDYSSSIEFELLLADLPDKFLTPTGRAMALERHDYMRGFFDRLRLEVGGQL